MSAFMTSRPFHYLQEKQTKKSRFYRNETQTRRNSQPGAKRVDSLIKRNRRTASVRRKMI